MKEEEHYLPNNKKITVGIKNCQFPGENKKYLVTIMYCKAENTGLVLTMIPAVFPHALPCQRSHGQGLIFLPLWIVFISCAV